MVVGVGLNVERMRELLRGLQGEDSQADARRHVISSHSGLTSTRDWAVTVLSAELLRDPSDLMSQAPPSWLAELSRSSQPGTILLFDSRLTELSARVVDDLLTQEVDSSELVCWLERHRWDPGREAP